MKLDKKLWALVDPTESYIMSGWEEPLIDDDINELQSSIRRHKNSCSYKERLEFLEMCKVISVVITKIGI